MRFTWQESKIWEAGDSIDPNGKVLKIKAISLEKAKKKLPRSSLGRTWILTETEEN